MQPGVLSAMGRKFGEWFKERFGQAGSGGKEKKEKGARRASEKSGPQMNKAPGEDTARIERAGEE